jgi:hypothetical protein
VTLLCLRDPKCTAVLPWSDKDFGRAPLTKDSKKPLNKAGVAKVYTDEFFMSTRQGGQFMRFRLGHLKPIAFYLDSPEVTNGLQEDASLYVDKIQDSNVSIAGWGAGPVLGRSTLEDTEEMLQNHPLFRSNKIEFIEIRVQQVRLKQGFWKKGEPRPLATHFFVRSRDTAKARKVLNTIYPSKPRADYPGGVQLRFVTNVADPYFPKTPRALKKAERLRAKQEQFQKETESVSTQCIKNLHYCLPSPPNVTLAQVIMNWRSSKDPDKRLFLHVEQTYEETVLLFHSTVSDEASQLVPFLPIILEQEYGPRAWNWFDKSAKDFLGGYEYDLETHRVIMKEEDINAGVDDNWEQGMGDDFEDDLSEDDNEGAGVFIDIGNIVIDATDRTRILDDESVATMKSSAEALRKIPTGWESEEEKSVQDMKETPEISKEPSTPSTFKEPSTPSTLSTTPSAFDVERMSHDQLERFMSQAAAKLKSTTAAPSKEDGGNK